MEEAFPSSAHQAKEGGGGGQEAGVPKRGPPTKGGGKKMGRNFKSVSRRQQQNIKIKKKTNKLNNCDIADLLPKGIVRAAPLRPQQKGTPLGLGVGGHRVSCRTYMWFPWLPENYLGGLRGRCSGSRGGARRHGRG